MDYRFAMLTLGRQITTKTTGGEAQAPWSNVSGVIAMPDARLSTFVISDDDTRFQSGRYAPDETGQTLTTAVTFGNDPSPSPAGTPLSFHNSSIIRSTTPNADGTHDEFQALFPRQMVPNAIGPELGGRYSVLLMPVMRADGSYPVFDLQESYAFRSMQSIGRSRDSTDYRPSAVTCFTLGTLIDTSRGRRPVESLRPGDRILTRDNGLQTLRWQGGTHVTGDGLDIRPNLRPVQIRAGALGPGTPATDLMVSPQHRVLIRSRIAHRLFKDAEILVAAKHLVGLPGIETVMLPRGVSYFHMLFDRHEIVRSNGAWSESLFTGPQALGSVSESAQREIAALFPDLVHGAMPRPARRLLTGREARRLAERQARNLGKRCLIETL